MWSFVEEQVIEDRSNLGTKEWGHDWTPDPILTDGQMVRFCSTVRTGATHFRKVNTRIHNGQHTRARITSAVNSISYTILEMILLEASTMHLFPFQGCEAGWGGVFLSSFITWMTMIRRGTPRKGKTC